MTTSRRLRAGLVEGNLQLALEVGQRALGLFDRQLAALDQRLDVELAHAAPLGDRLVHQRLGVAGIVALVVAVAAVADHVDDDVLVERLAVFERQLGNAHARLGVVAVDVEDRRLHRLGDIAAVQRAARVLRAGGEADLVVDDQVDGAADAVALDVAHRQALGDHALAGERGVAVDQDRQRRERAGRIDAVLHGAHHAQHDRVDRFEVARDWPPARRGCRLRVGLSYLPVAPRWYFTSPEPCTELGSMWPSNSLKIWS